MSSTKTFVQSGVPFAVHALLMIQHSLTASFPYNREYGSFQQECGCTGRGDCPSRTAKLATILKPLLSRPRTSRKFKSVCIGLSSTKLVLLSSVGVIADNAFSQCRRTSYKCFQPGTYPRHNCSWEGEHHRTLKHAYDHRQRWLYRWKDHSHRHERSPPCPT